jgi:nucleoid DNA-binding protein
MRKRAWLALAALAGSLGVLIPVTAPAQPQRPRGEETLNQRLAREGKVTEEQAGRVFNAIGPAVRDQLAKGNTVSIPGLGTFRVVRVAGHRDMEAGTGRVFNVPARNTVEFLATDGLADVANSAAAVPAETVPAFEFNPLPNQSKGQKTGPTRTEGTRTR